LDRQLTALKNIDLPAFFYDSIQLYGTPDDKLVQLAKNLLARTSVAAADGELPTPDYVPADEIVAAARDQIDHYHQLLPGFVAKVLVRNDLASTMMVAHDALLISA